MTKPGLIALSLMLMATSAMATNTNQVATRSIDLKSPIQQYQIQNHSQDTI